jgi:hypothetical protein
MISLAVALVFVRQQAIAAQAPVALGSDATCAVLSATTAGETSVIIFSILFYD